MPYRRGRARLPRDLQVREPYVPDAHETLGGDALERGLAKLGWTISPPERPVEFESRKERPPEKPVEFKTEPVKKEPVKTEETMAKPTARPPVIEDVRVPPSFAADEDQDMARDHDAVEDDFGEGDPDDDRDLDDGDDHDDEDRDDYDDDYEDHDEEVRDDPPPPPPPPPAKSRAKKDKKPEPQPEPEPEPEPESDEDTDEVDEPKPAPAPKKASKKSNKKPPKAERRQQEGPAPEPVHTPPPPAPVMTQELVDAVADAVTARIEAAMPKPPPEPERRRRGEEREPAPTQVLPVTADHLYAIARRPPVSLRGKRDFAMLMIGFSAALRRSEVTSLRLEHLVFADEGLAVVLPRSKDVVFIHKTEDRICTVQAIAEWIASSGLQGGYLFRKVINGVLDRRAERKLPKKDVNKSVKRAMRRVGLDTTGYDWRSMRAGFLVAVESSRTVDQKIDALRRGLS